MISIRVSMQTHLTHFLITILHHLTAWQRYAKRSRGIHRDRYDTTAGETPQKSSSLHSLSAALCCFAISSLLLTRFRFAGALHSPWTVWWRRGEALMGGKRYKNGPTTAMNRMAVMRNQTSNHQWHEEGSKTSALSNHHSILFILYYAPAYVDISYAFIILLDTTKLKVCLLCSINIAILSKFITYVTKALDLLIIYFPFLLS